MQKDLDTGTPWDTVGEDLFPVQLRFQIQVLGEFVLYDAK